jgi:hypothetical protein
MKQDFLIDDKNTTPFDAESEWWGMPEFVQEKQKPFAKVICRFETQEDLDAFAALIGQKLTPKTKSIWYPFKSHWGGIKGRYKSES